jgi:hypothetical protein
MPRGLHPEGLRDLTRTPKTFRLAREFDTLMPPCARCGHAALAHHDKTGCLHKACLTTYANDVCRSSCPGYVTRVRKKAA